MKSGFYVKLAWNNIKKNYRFFIPRILSEIGLLGCFYIAVTLALDGRLAEIRGGDYIPFFMWIAVIVLGLLSTILIFYTNSFLMKQRKNEFGIYNVLGMEKRHIGKVLFHESFISCGVSVVFGLLFGVLFYKLCSLLICKLLKATIIIGFYFITPITLIPAAGFFILLDLLSYLFNLISIALMKPVDLLASKQRGEKEPKIKWVMLVFGVLTLGAGYYIALTTQNPLAALGLFLLAVLLVIIGTYFIFVSGSIFVLKALKKNQKFYYNKKRMPAVSGLIYRMKQNAVGLASIAILATGVLVMVSTTVSLYTGLQGTLDKNYPQDFYSNGDYTTEEGKTEIIPYEVMEDYVVDAAQKNDLKIKSMEKQLFLEVSYLVDNNELLSTQALEGRLDLSGVTNFVIITRETYENLTGNKLNLKTGEIATCRISSSAANIKDLSGIIKLHDMEFNVAEVVYSFPISIPILASGFTQYGIVVPDEAALGEIYKAQCEDYEQFASNYSDRIAVVFENRDETLEKGEKFQQDYLASLHGYLDTCPIGEDGYWYNVDSYWDARTSVIGMYGSLLFLGILLGSVCMFATVLIIYYKQISEGYEDRERFRIMEKIGMSKSEVKKTINSQVLLVFFLPLITAGVHIAFAYPMLQNMLKILMLYDPMLFFTCTVIGYLVFALVYVLIYKGTSRSYYKIVK